MKEEEGHGQARNTDPETSHVAARRNRLTLRMRVLRVYADAGENGCTIDEVCERYEGTSPDGSISPRSHELLVRGLIEDTDERRPTRYRAGALVRRITQAGMDALREREAAA